MVLKSYRYSYVILSARMAEDGRLQDAIFSHLLKSLFRFSVKMRSRFFFKAYVNPIFFVINFTRQNI